MANAGLSQWLILSTYNSQPFQRIYKTGCASGSAISSNNTCMTCPPKTYSSSFNATSCTSCPYSAMTTPSAGTTSKTQCFNPISSFLLAIVCFMIAPVLVLIYFIQCRLHFVSFVRVQLVISRLQFTVRLFCKYIDEIGLYYFHIIIL